MNVLRAVLLARPALHTYLWSVIVLTLSAPLDIPPQQDEIAYDRYQAEKYPPARVVRVVQPSDRHSQRGQQRGQVKQQLKWLTCFFRKGLMPCHRGDDCTVDNR